MYGGMSWPVDVVGWLPVQAENVLLATSQVPVIELSQKPIGFSMVWK